MSNISTQPYVFISYKREEVAYAQRMKKALEAAGLLIWWDEDIQCGQVWSNILDDAIRNASCIVVLWSRQALESQWVRHEASIAMDRKIYAPARIELVEISAPYNRHQATDLISWDGDLQHPGITDLEQRVRDLIPEPVPVLIRLRKWLWRTRTTLVSIVFGLCAIGLLSWQAWVSRHQVEQINSVVDELKAVGVQQDRVARDIERAVHPIEEVKVDLFLNVVGGHPLVDQYLVRVAKAIDQGLETEQMNLDANVISSRTVGNTQRPELIEFGMESSLAPRVTDEKPVRNLLWQSLYSISFFAEPINPTIFTKPTSDAPTPDLHFLVYTDLSFIWDTDTRTLSIHAKTADDGGLWSRTGRIVSIPDLTRSWFFLKLTDKVSSIRSATQSPTPEDSFTLRSFSISMTGGRRFLFAPKDLIFHSSSDGIGYYSMEPSGWNKAMRETAY